MLIFSYELIKLDAVMVTVWDEIEQVWEVPVKAVQVVKAWMIRSEGKVSMIHPSFGI